MSFSFSTLSQRAVHQNHVLSGTIQLNITTSPSTCGGSNAGIFIDPSGGTPPYTYSLDGGASQNSGVFFRIAGDHTLTVSDATGQSVTTTVTTINNGPRVGLNVVGSVNQSGCAAKDASVTLQGIDGTPPYSYSMDLENWQTDPTFSNLPGGNYFFYVKDVAGCIRGVWVPLHTCVAMSVANQDPSCGKQDGSLNMAAIGGQPPYSYSLDGINWQSTGVFTGLGPGLQTLQIKDSRGVIMYYGYYLVNYCQLMLAADALDGTCGNNDGTITATAKNGQPPYQYTIDGIHYQNSNMFTGLTPGRYTIGVRDASGTAQWLDLTVGNVCPTVTAMVTDASCGNNNGTITITGNGGATPYSYSIDGIHFQNSNIFSGLAPGDYTVSLKDLNGKPAQITVTVNSGCLQPISLVLSTTDENCGRKNGTISVTATGGTAPYQYSLNGTDFQDEPVFSQLASGNYTITVKDILGNSVKKDTAITNLEGPPAKIFVGNDTSVLAGQPVPLHISDLGNSGFTQFTWSPAEGLNNPASSDPVAVLQHNITYTATAWADEGCPAVDSISIKVFTVADIFVPNAFTPNGDNRNDILRAIPVGIREFKYFAVYSRLGQRLFYTADPGKGWTGIINGRPELTGAYVWMAAGIDYSGQLIERRGTVILIR